MTGPTTRSVDTRAVVITTRDTVNTTINYTYMSPRAIVKRSATSWASIATAMSTTPTIKKHYSYVWKAPISNVESSHGSDCFGKKHR